MFLCFAISDKDVRRYCYSTECHVLLVIHIFFILIEPYFLLLQCFWNVSWKQKWYPVRKKLHTQSDPTNWKSRSVKEKPKLMAVVP